jgi:hypothetical protein
MEEVTGKEIMEMAKIVALSYKRKMPNLSQDNFKEIISEAALTIVKCKKTYKEQYGSFRKYAMFSANRRIGIFLCHVNSPISTPDSAKYLPVLCYSKKVSLNDLPWTTPSELGHLKTERTFDSSKAKELSPTMDKRVKKTKYVKDEGANITTENYVDAKKALDRISSIGGSGISSGEASVVLGLKSYEDLSRETGIEVRELYKKVAKFRKKVMKDNLIKEYFK